jgi:hypothetical protein
MKSVTELEVAELILIPFPLYMRIFEEIATEGLKQL